MQVVSNIMLSTLEQDLLGRTLQADCTFIELPGLDVRCERIETNQAHSPDQKALRRDTLQPAVFSFELDPHSILLLVFSSASFIFLKKLTEEAASDTWNVIHALLVAVGKRFKAKALSSVQVRFSVYSNDGNRNHITITFLNARFVSREAWRQMVAACVLELSSRLSKCGGLLEDEKCDDSDGATRNIIGKINPDGSCEWNDVT